MMYSEKLAVALKSAGKVLREFKDEVYVPFGTEYSIFIKNLNSVRALVSVSIDGEDVGDGTRFVVDANDSIDLERFLRNGNRNRGNRFKFIERTDAVENHRGVGVEDGIVRVEFQFERKFPDYYTTTTCWPTWYNPNGNVYYNHTIGNGTGDSPLRGQTTFTASASSERFVSSNSINVSSSVGKAEVENDAGITVPGSISNQKFEEAGWFPVETETHVIVLKILGETKDNVKVRRPVTVKTKPRCTSCGSLNKATAKFCTECGTSLTIV